jgi:hypothetical protein
MRELHDGQLEGHFATKNHVEEDIECGILVPNYVHRC